MSPADILSVILACAPNVAPSTMQAIVSVESRGNPYAIGVNADVYLTRQPANAAEAVAWARWLRINGYNFDAGLGQVNSANWERLGVTPENVFEPCTNIRAAGQILTDNYRWALSTKAPGTDALLAAVSAYNTGNLRAGFRNGYVRNFVDALAGQAGTTSPAAPAIAGPSSQDVPPLVRKPSKPGGRVALAKASLSSTTRSPVAEDFDWENPVAWQTPSEWGASQIPDTNSTATTSRNP